jgi:flagellar hook-length control protein FliK
MSLPIPTATPAVSAAPATSANAAQGQSADASSDPFGSILARQMEDASAAHGSGTHSTTAADAASKPDVANKKPDQAQQAAPDNAAMPQADLIAAMLNIPVVQANSSQLVQKTTAPSVTTDGTAINPDSSANTKLLLAAVNAKPAPADAIKNPDSVNVKPAQGGQNFSAALQAFNVNNTNAAAMTDGKRPAPQPIEGAGQMPAALAMAADAVKTDTSQTAAPQPTVTEQSQFIPPSPQAINNNAALKVELNTPVGSAQWGEDFNTKVTWVATQHEQSAEIHLNPPHLGPIDIILKISGDQATALFVSPGISIIIIIEQLIEIFSKTA